MITPSRDTLRDFGDDVVVLNALEYFILHRGARIMKRTEQAVEPYRVKLSTIRSGMAKSSSTFIRMRWTAVGSRKWLQLDQVGFVFDGDRAYHHAYIGERQPHRGVMEKGRAVTMAATTRADIHLVHCKKEICYCAGCVPSWGRRWIGVDGWCGFIVVVVSKNDHFYSSYAWRETLHWFDKAKSLSFDHRGWGRVRAHARIV